MSINLKYHGLMLNVFNKGFCNRNSNLQLHYIITVFVILRENSYSLNVVEIERCALAVVLDGFS